MGVRLVDCELSCQSPLFVTVDLTVMQIRWRLVAG
jgi:hypothetical protein